MGGGGSPTINQEHYRWADDDNATIGSTTFLANEDATYEVELDTPIIIWVSIGNSGTKSQNNMNFEINANVDGGGSQRVSGSTANGIRSVGGQPADADAISTSRLTAPQTTFVNGEYDEVGGDNATGAISLGADEYTEVAFCIQADSAVMSGGESVTLVVTYDAGTAVDNENVTISLTVAVAPVQVGLVTETDTALGVTALKTLAAGLTEEADTALAAIADKALEPGLITETDTPLSITADKALELGLPTEADTAFDVSTGEQIIPVGLASESDSALAAGHSRSLEPGLASETDEALVMQTALKERAVGLTTETDTPLAATANKATEVGLTTETDEALAAGYARSAAVGLASETDTALAVIGGAVAVLAAKVRGFIVKLGGFMNP